MTDNKSILAWHFVGTTLRNGDPIPPDGEWLEWDGPLRMCKQGLHASRRIIDALWYAPGSTICRVRLAGNVQENDDKMVGRRRKILWRIDGEPVLRRFAKDCVLSLADKWDMPPVVRQYLECNTEELRTDAHDAARAAICDAAYGTAQNKAWHTARAAASDATWDEAWYAARAAAWTAARDTAAETARYTIWHTYNKRLTKAVMAAHKKEVGNE